jgi:hypothetical protein
VYVQYLLDSLADLVVVTVLPWAARIKSYLSTNSFQVASGHAILTRVGDLGLNSSSGRCSVAGPQPFRQINRVYLQLTVAVIKPFFRNNLPVDFSVNWIKQQTPGTFHQVLQCPIWEYGEQKQHAQLFFQPQL